jgi:hypothetical protein
MLQSSPDARGAALGREQRPDPYDLVSQAVAIAMHQRSWLDALPCQYLDDGLIPAALNDRMLMLCDGQAFATIAFPFRIPKHRIHSGIWSEDGPHLWIIDAVGLPSLPWMSVGLSLRRALITEGFAKRGDKVFFWRMNAGRYGFVTM